MPDITVRTPTVGMEAFFSLKEPFNAYIGNKFNINLSNIKLKVISIISMRDSIRSDLVDPFVNLYEPAGISEVDYKVDLNNSVPLLSLSYENEEGIERYIRVPLNYVNEISDETNIEYMNRNLVLDLGYLPKDLDLEVMYNDIKNFITDRVGVTPSIRDVTIGDVVNLSPYENDLRETVRTNTVIVHKTDSIKLAELQHAHDQLLNRLTDLGITLG